MRLGAIPESIIERIALWANLAPVPILDTQIAFTGARAIMAAAELGVFEALAAGEKSDQDVAAACRTDPKATKQLPARSLRAPPPAASGLPGPDLGMHTENCVA